jgi:hypothetical protein
VATVNKNFKVKAGLVVEGTTGTINGEDILTKAQADIDYIIGEVGGSGVSANTPDTLVLRDGNGDFAAGTITADLVGDVTGTVSDISNHDTDDLSEGATNKYFTTGRVKDVLTGSTQTNISITEIAGELHITAENGVADSDTDDLDEGATNKYFTDARARGAISAGTGINYDSNSGVVSADLADFDTDDVSEGATNKYFTTTRVDNHLSGGDGITYSAGTISADVAGGLHIDAAQIKIDRTTVDGWYDANGAAGDVAGDLSTHEGLTSGVHGVTGSVVGTTDDQDLSNKRIIDTLYFTDGVTISDEGEIAVRAVSHDFDVQANQGDLNLKTVASGSDVNISSTYGDILLDPNGTAYYGSASAENEIATHGYVDNAISGLAWKQSVNLLSTTNVNISGDLVGAVIDGHAAFTTANNGYRILLTGQTTGTENGLYELLADGATLLAYRTADGNTYDELVGAAVYVMEGTTYGSTSWVQGNHYLSSFTGQSWTQFSGQGSVTAGSGITVDGLEVSIDRATVDTWYDATGAASSVGTDLSNHALDTSTHGVAEIVGTSETQTLTNKTINASSNTISNIANSSLTNSAITVNGYSTSLGDSVTLDTDDVSEGTAQYFTEARARQSLSSGTAINYDNVTGVISVDATELDTDDIAEGVTNQYYTDSRVKSVLTASTQSNISITEVAGELIITAENGVADSTTDDLEEGATNHYYTDTRSKTATADLLTSATLSNITITGDENGLTITAENGVAGSDTDDLTEGSTNLYFTDQRVLDAVSGSDITPNSVEIDSYRKEEATRVSAGSTATVNLHSFQYPYESAKYLVRVVGWVGGVKHSQLAEILMTVDGNNNIAMTEYGTISTNDASLASFSATEASGVYTLTATIAGATSCEVATAATMLSWAD